MNFLFAWRYFRSKKSTNAINVIAWISVLAIAVGSAALIIVLSVFNGFEGLVKSLYTDFYADMRIVPAAGGKTFRLSQDRLTALRSTHGIAVVSLVAEEKALLVNGEAQSIVLVKGVDENFTGINQLASHIKRGKFSLGSLAAPELVLGAGIENAVFADVEKKFYPLTLYTPNRGAKFGSLEGLNVFNVTASGAFVLQQDFDNRYVFTNLPFLKYMLNMKADEYSAVELKVNDDPDKVKARLQTTLGNDFLVETRYEQNKSLYAVMQMEKWVIYAILSLILVVAAFNMIGTLTMLVLEKEKDIAVLQAMGANRQRVQSIFMAEGLLLAGLGGTIGMLLAGFICWLQLKFKLIKLSGDTFIIDYYPVKLMPADFILVAFTVTLIAFIAAWVPARKASQGMISLRASE